MPDNIKMGDAFDLGTWLGRKQGFAALAGRCSAADAECLRTIRQKRSPAREKPWGNRW